MHPADPWRVTELGDGIALRSGDEIRLTLPPADASTYHDAQISDYDAKALAFKNAPPLRLSVQARADCQDSLQGTAGFGFWNHAFVPGKRGFRIPQALWFFFGSANNDMSLAKGVPGSGWKAATFNARNWRFFAMLPAAPLGLLLMRSRLLYDAFWPLGQAAIGVSEAALDRSLLDEYHSYTIEWRPDVATFAVDGDVVLRTERVPPTPLGFIAWIDNQYAIVTPQGKFGWGLLDVPRAQSLHLRDLQLTAL